MYFDARFQTTLERMAEHRRFIAEELQILELTKLKDRDRRAAEYHAFSQRAADKLDSALRNLEINQRQESNLTVIHRIREWLAAPPFARTLEDSQALREDGISEWVFQDPAFSEMDVLPAPDQQ